jgi:hypothetical protein
MTPENISSLERRPARFLDPDVANALANFRRLNRLIANRPQAELRKKVVQLRVLA